MIRFQASRGIRGVAAVLVDGKKIGFVRMFATGDWRCKFVADETYSEERGHASRQAAAEALVARAAASESPEQGRARPNDEAAAYITEQFSHRMDEV